MIKSEDGFTLIEIIAVLIIIGILSAVAISRMTGTGAELAGQLEKIKGHLRYAQARAMSSGSDDVIWGIRFNTAANSYFLFSCTAGCNPSTGSTAGKVALPGADSDANLNVSVNDGVAITGLTDRTIVFDRLGRPYQYGSDQCQVPPAAGRLMNASSTITLTDNSGSTQMLTITPETGYIP